MSGTGASRRDGGWHDPMTPAIYAVFSLGVVAGLFIASLIAGWL